MDNMHIMTYCMVWMKMMIERAPMKKQSKTEQNRGSYNNSKEHRRYIYMNERERERIQFWGAIMREMHANKKRKEFGRRLLRK